jgi:hypothetical protein
MVSSMERRRFSRLIIPLAVRYQTLSPESGEPHQGQGVIRDISLSGCFFHVDHTVAFQPGHFLYLSIAAPLPFLGSDHNSHLTATGEVVRLEPSGFATPNYGVAVNFVENLSFA